MYSPLLRRARQFRVGPPAQVSLVLREHPRAQLDQVSSRRPVRRCADIDAVPLDDLTDELEALVSAWRLDRRGEIRDPAVQEEPS